MTRYNPYRVASVLLALACSFSPVIAGATTANAEQNENKDASKHDGEKALNASPLPASNQAFETIQIRGIRGSIIKSNQTKPNAIAMQSLMQLLPKK